MLDLVSELRAALDASRDLVEDIVRRAVRSELARWGHGDPSELLDCDHAAELVHMTPAALRRAAQRGTFPAKAIRLGRRIRFRRGDLLEVAGRRRGPETP